jgi:hypothetical protein
MQKVLRGAREVTKKCVGTIYECVMVLGYDFGLEMIVEHRAVFLVPRSIRQAREEPRETHPLNLSTPLRRPGEITRGLTLQPASF